MEYLTDEDYQTAEKNGISRARAYQRLYSLGWSKANAITKPVDKQISIWGQYKEISKVSRTTFIKRVESGMDPIEAATKPIDRRGRKKAVENEYIEIATKNGIPYHTLYIRVFEYGWDMDRATSEPVNEAKAGKRGKKSKMER